MVQLSTYLAYLLYAIREKMIITMLCSGGVSVGIFWMDNGKLHIFLVLDLQLCCLSGQQVSPAPVPDDDGVLAQHARHIWAVELIPVMVEFRTRTGWEGQPCQSSSLRFWFLQVCLMSLLQMKKCTRFVLSSLAVPAPAGALLRG